MKPARAGGPPKPSAPSRRKYPASCPSDGPLAVLRAAMRVHLGGSLRRDAESTAYDPSILGPLRGTLTALAVIGMLACGVPAASTATQSPVPIPASPTPGLDPVPLELRAAWTTRLGDETMTLTLFERSYAVRRGPNRTTGGLGTRDGEIRFLASTACNGTGTYRWSLQGNSLRFSPVSPDECPGRFEIMDNTTYQREGTP